MTNEYQNFLELDKDNLTLKCRYNSTSDCTLKCLECPIFKAAMRQLYAFESIIKNKDIDDDIGTIEVDLTSGGAKC